jgi:hypothetical protein
MTQIVNAERAAVRSIAWLDVGVISLLAFASGGPNAQSDDGDTSDKTQSRRNICLRRRHPCSKAITGNDLMPLLGGAGSAENGKRQEDHNDAADELRDPTLSKWRCHDI